MHPFLSPAFADFFARHWSRCWRYSAELFLELQKFVVASTTFYIHPPEKNLSPFFLSFFWKHFLLPPVLFGRSPRRRGEEFKTSTELSILDKNRGAPGKSVLDAVVLEGFEAFHRRNQNK